MRPGTNGGRPWSSTICGQWPGMLNEHFVLLAAAFNLMGSTSYAWATLRGRTRPNRVTWSLWALAPLIAFAAEVKEGVGLPALMTFMVGFGPALILLASFVNRSAFWAIRPFDITCGALSLMALALWAVTRTGDIAIIFSIATDGLAASPTIVKAYRHPESERGITILTVRVWSLASVGFPIYIAACCTLIATPIVRRQRPWAPGFWSRSAVDTRA